VAIEAHGTRIETTLSPDAIEVTKSTLAVAQFGGFSPPINMHAVTADAYGYITVDFGKFNGSNTGFIVLGPDGTSRGDGGGARFMLNTTQAVVPSMLK
jgi:hypothetical protein